VIDSIEKFLQIKINAPAVAFSDILLRLCHRLMSRPSRPEPVAAIGECPVPPPLQNLEYRLLDESIQHRRDAQFSDTSPVRFGDSPPSHRLGFESPVQQLSPDSWPVLFQVVLHPDDSHLADAWTPLIGPPPPQCCLQVFSLTYFLH